MNNTIMNRLSLNKYVSLLGSATPMSKNVSGCRHTTTRKQPKFNPATKNHGNVQEACQGKVTDSTWPYRSPPSEGPRREDTAYDVDTYEKAGVSSRLLR
mmetsp:Transcript_51643/g.147471  ORF Transcript_51643/g.147471 Transcript_51643/m.147471 type:complete len:99 (-) Transcript_51643:163-459(-)